MSRNPGNDVVTHLLITLPTKDTILYSQSTAVTYFMRSYAFKNVVYNMDFTTTFKAKLLQC